MIKITLFQTQANISSYFEENEIIENNNSLENTNLGRVFFFFGGSQICAPKLASGRIEPDTLRGAHPKVPSPHHQANPSGFWIDLFYPID